MSVTSYNWFLNKYVDENWAWIKTFTPEECDQIIKLGLSLQVDRAVAADDAEHKIRKSKVSWIPTEEQNHWIFDKCAGMVIQSNSQFFNYDLQYIENLQFGIYDSSEIGFYGRHIDTQYISTGTRKLSFSILLSDPESYEGGELLLHYKKEPHQAAREQGLSVIFPSAMLHEVTPVTKGIRYSLVGWVVGPRFK
jgi:PKHD-type hydroxylase